MTYYLPADPGMDILHLTRRRASADQVDFQQLASAIDDNSPQAEEAAREIQKRLRELPARFPWFKTGR